MVNPQQHTPDEARQQLSSLMDGELDPADWAATCRDACDSWHREDGLRSDWHAWHLIGDALRSDELATVPARDTAFLNALRARLATEPVVLAPMPPPTAAAPGARRQAWLMPSVAVAAGFIAVAGTMLVMRSQPEAPSAAATLAAASSPATDVWITLDRNAVVGARLDDYLSAHRRQALAGPGAMPGGVRQVELLAVEPK